MSQAPSTSTSSSNFQSIFNAALKVYEKKIKKDILAHPLAAQLQACNSPADILVILQDRVKELDQPRNADERLSRWLNPTIDDPYTFPATRGEGVGLIFSLAKVLLASAEVLLLAAKEVKTGQDALANLFERIENFFKRLESYTSVRPTDLMTDMIVKIMVEVLNIFAIATKEMARGYPRLHFRQRSDTSGYYPAEENGRPGSLFSTNSSLQSYYTANMFPSPSISACSSTTSLPYSATSVNSYKSNKNVLYPRREHSSPLALPSQLTPTAHTHGDGTDAASSDDEGGTPLDDSQIEFGAFFACFQSIMLNAIHGWRVSRRTVLMVLLSRFGRHIASTYVPLIPLVAVFESR
ncbi:hypothetical protein H4582DRAFT_2078639 [Lactarius indigo]|nr:hypothetical protein H4582DRAFT_2078639 [Lactarius indigo]